MKNKLINIRLVLFIATSFFIGLYCSYLIYFFKKYYIAVIIFALFFIFISAFFIVKKLYFKKILFLILINIIFFILACFAFYLHINKFTNAFISEKEYSISGKVSQIYVEDENNARISIFNICINENKLDTNLKLSLYINDYSENQINYNDKIFFSSIIKNNGIFYGNKPSVNNILTKTVYNATAKMEDIRVIKGKPNIFQKANLFINKNLKLGLSENNYKLSIGLLTGETQIMDNEVIQNYRYGGIAHIFAVSGLHIGFLAVLLSLLLSKIKKQYFKSTIISLILIFYTGICGFTVSATRATTMAIILLFANSSGKKYDSLSSASLAMILIMLFSPFQVFTVGFLLSFSAVFSIILLSPVFKRVFRFLPLKINNYLSPVFSATIGTLPLCAYFFKYISLISVILNIFLIPVISIVFYFLLIGVVIGGIFNILSITCFIPQIMLNVINIIMENDFKIFTVSIYITAIYVILYYFIIFISSDILNIKSVTKKMLSVILIFVFIFGAGLNNIADNKKIKMCVIGGSENQIVAFYGKKTDIILNAESVSSNFNRLKSFIKVNNLSVIDNLVIVYDTDIESIVTNVSGYCAIKKVYYYGENLTYLQNGMNIDFISINGEENVKSENIEFTYLSNGRIVCVKANDANILIISQKMIEDDYLYLENGKFDLIIAKGNADNYQNIFNADVIGFIYENDLLKNSEYFNLYYKISERHIIEVKNV